MIKQRLCGVILVILGILVPFINNGDATASLILVPLGLCVMFAKEYISWDGDDE